MKKRTPDRFWFPWWPDKWIFGSVRIECTPAERGIWVDLLSLASKDDGHIRANEETPYPLQQLAGMLIIPEQELEAAINKFIGNEKLTLVESGTLYVTKWEKYQFTDRHKRRVRQEMSEKAAVPAGNKDAILYNNRLNKITLDNNKKETKKKTAAAAISFSFDKKVFSGITDQDIMGWGSAYPACNIKQELHRMREWLLANPDKRKINYRRFVVNWMSKTQDQGGTKGLRPKDTWAEKKAEEMKKK